jgi:hypothetical protein
MAPNKMGDDETFIASRVATGGDLFLHSEDERFCIGSE